MIERRLRGNQPFRAAVNLLCWEGAFAMAYETWIGGTYVSGLAGELGTSIALVSLLTALPFIGSAGQLLGVLAFSRVRSVKAYTLGVAAAARALWALPFAAALFWGARERWQGQPFPTARWFTLVAVTACLSSVFSSSSVMAWMSWMRGLVPGSFRGRFFAARQRYFMPALILANLVAASWVGWRPGGLRAGYAVLCALALVAAGFSTALLFRVPDIAPRRPAAAGARRGSLRQFLVPFRNAEFRRILIFSAAFNGALQIAGSYFPYYFTRDLKIPMSTIAVWAMITNLGCFLAAGFWGHQIDRRDPRRVLWIACHMIAFSPLPYLLPTAAMIRWVAPFEYLTNGFAWSGYILALTTLQLRAVPEEDNAVYFSVLAAASGLSGAACIFLGGKLAQWLLPIGGFRALWIVASLCRLAVVWGLGRRIGLGPKRAPA